MCGIHFVLTSSAYASYADDFMADCFLANQVRGVHSSGIFQLGKGGGRTMYKRAVSGSEFLTHKFAQDIIKATPRSPLTVGHVRHATAGAITDQNAHPFEVAREDGSRIMGVHNGTLKDWRYKQGGDDHSVDSEWAFATLARENFDAFEYFDGAFAMVWHDTAKPDSVFMVRNAERPLYFMITEDNNTMIGASELGMLGWLAERNKLKVKPKDGTFYLSPGMLYEFDLKNIGKYKADSIPEYNKETGVYKAEPNFTSPRSPLALQHYSRQDDKAYGEDWDYEDGMWWGGYPSTQSEPSGMDTKLRAVHDALGVARTARQEEISGVRVIKPDEVEDKDLEDAIRQRIEEHMHEKTNGLHDVLLVQPQFVHSPNDRNCTRSEVQGAKDRRIYGEVVAFSGVHYDAQTAVLLGEFEAMEEDGSIGKFDGELRFPTRKGANAYFDPTNPQLVVVVGCSEHVKGYPSVVVAALTSSQRKMVQARLETLVKKAH